jgi:predicted enzyme related to lactoylglutathione lyase
MSKVTGIGGVFFKCKDPSTTMKWYSEKLGLVTDPKYGTSFGWREMDAPEMKGYTAWSPMKNETKYFGHEEQQFMVNYRVDNLHELIKNLGEAGVKILGEIQRFEYGHFAHIEDCDGRKVELWQPIDTEYEKITDNKITK